MGELKTKVNDASVEAFLNGVEDAKKREDSFTILKLMQEITGEAPRMWGDSIVGFGSYHYKYASGQEGDWLITGFSPRKQAITLYIMDGLDNHKEKLGAFGKFKTGKSCLYIKKLEDVNLEILKELVRNSIESINRK
jgi:hypothetical protein